MDSDAESSSYSASESCVEVEDFSPAESSHFDQNDDSAGPLPYLFEPLDPHLHTLECKDEPDEASIEVSYWFYICKLGIQRYLVYERLCLNIALTIMANVEFYVHC